jgi:hypothetical protein
MHKTGFVKVCLTHYFGLPKRVLDPRISGSIAVMVGMRVSARTDEATAPGTTDHVRNLA